MHLGLVLTVECWCQNPSKETRNHFRISYIIILDRWLDGICIRRYNVCVKQESAIPPSPKYKLQHWAGKTNGQSGRILWQKTDKHQPSLGAALKENLPPMAKSSFLRFAEGGWNIWATKKNLTTFHYTVCLIGILKMVYYNAYITGEYNALYTPTNHGFFIAHIKRLFPNLVV